MLASGVLNKLVCDAGVLNKLVCDASVLVCDAKLGVLIRWL